MQVLVDVFLAAIISVPFRLDVNISDVVVINADVNSIRNTTDSSLP